MSDFDFVKYVRQGQVEVVIESLEYIKDHNSPEEMQAAFQTVVLQCVYNQNIRILAKVLEKYNDMKVDGSYVAPLLSALASSDNPALVEMSIKLCPTDKRDEIDMKNCVIIDSLYQGKYSLFESFGLAEEKQVKYISDLLFKLYNREGNASDLEFKMLYCLENFSYNVTDNFKDFLYLEKNETNSQRLAQVSNYMIGQYHGGNFDESLELQRPDAVDHVGEASLSDMMVICCNIL